MSETLTAREEVLSRIRAALPVERSAAAIPRAYQRSGSLDSEACLQLLRDRLLDYGAEILEAAAESDIPAAIATALQNAAERKLIAAPEFPSAWLPTDFEIVLDHALPVDAIEGIPAVVTTSEAAIASTGTILLVHRGAQGRRVLTLLPDHHICMVNRARIFELVPEAIAAVDAHKVEPITTISGPSATSDIEMTRIRGVHGPRYLTVILYS